MSPYNGSPMTLGNAAAARVRLIVWCLDCRHQVETNPSAMAERYGAEMSVPDCTSGSSAASAAAGGSISSSPANGAPHRSRRRGCRSCVSAALVCCRPRPPRQTAAPGDFAITRSRFIEDKRLLHAEGE
jgi:hypothetical protein